MYYFKLVHYGVVVMMRALHAQGTGINSGPGSTPSCIPLFHEENGWHSLGSCQG